MNYKAAYIFLFSQITNLTEQLKKIQLDAEELCIADDKPEE